LHNLIPTLAHDFAHDPLFKLYAGCCITLCGLLMFLAGYTGATRVRHKAFGNPEDAKSAGQDPAQVNAPLPPEVTRVLRAHGNALENIPLFFTLGLIYVIAGASPVGGYVCFLGFTAMRVLHAVFHIRAVQPYRSMTFGVGMLLLLAMMVLIGVALAA